MKLRGLLDFNRFAWYLLLFPLFFILHGNNENFGLIPITNSALLFLKYSLLTVGFFIVSYFLFRHRNKAAIYSLLVLCIYFFFGAFHDFVKEHISNVFFVSYKFLFSFIALVLVFFFLLFRKSKSSFLEIIRYSHYTLGILVLLELGIAAYSLLTRKVESNFIAPKHSVISSVSTCAKKKPDIFFIVFDEYASSKSLQQDFDFSNNMFDSLLSAHRFYTAADSKSNYNSTPFSIASTLNFDYLQTTKRGEALSAKKFLQAERTVKENRLTAFLQNQGYVIKNYGCMDLAGAPAETTPYFKDVITNLIDGQTLISRIRRDIWWQFTTRNIFTGSFQIPDYYKESKQYHLYRNQYNWNQLLKEIHRKSDTPRFVYTHMMLPHEPFYLDSLGKEISDTSIILQTLNDRQGYLNQVVYTNRLIEFFLKQIPKNTQRDLVIIMEGDHGYKFEHGEPQYKFFTNLNAYYFSDNDYTTLYEGISPVNTFRVVLNKYFCQSLPLLKDSSIYLPPLIN